jgi:hypothetical protein
MLHETQLVGALDLYSRGTRFRSQLEEGLSWVFFVVFLSLQGNARIISRLDHNFLFPVLSDLLFVIIYCPIIWCCTVWTS